MKNFKIIIFVLSISFTLMSCQLAKLGGDAKENPPDPKLRVKKNLEEGKGFRLNDLTKGKRGGDWSSREKKER